MIPKTLHIIWVGDESKRPDNCIRTWVEHHPDWTVKVWGNDALAETDWINTRHMREMARRELNGVADMMRWEILYNEGGFVVDADSICVRRLDDALLDCEAFACWESEIARPGLIAAGYFACAAANPFVGQIVADIHKEASVVGDLAWKTVGPQRLTDSYRRYAYHGLSILPSHYFIPEHFSGVRYQGPGPIYAHQEWASTKRSYDTLHLKQLAATAPQTTTADAARERRPATPPLPLPGRDSAPQALATSASAAASTPDHSALEARHPAGRVQRVLVSRELAGRNVRDVFAQICRGRKVLLVGCGVAGDADPADALHVALAPHCGRLDGVDSDAAALARLAGHHDGLLFASFDDLTERYDLVLVPDLLACSADPGALLKRLQALGARRVLLTVPDASRAGTERFAHLDATDTVVEIADPAQQCWYTPYTLTRTIATHTAWRVDGLWFVDPGSLMLVASVPTLN